MATLKEVLLQSLEKLCKIANYKEVYEFIATNNLHDFGKGKTPASTVSAELGNFIRQGDTRVKRLQGKGGSFYYYLTKQEDSLPIQSFSQSVTSLLESIEPELKQKEVIKDYDERSLHKLLSSYLRSQNTYSKTIFHEVSTYGKDNNQIWTHPDMVGIQFMTLQHKVSQSLIKTVNKVDTFRMYSYELKKEITTDNELKKAYFQAVSNSSWANYGYLVAFSISSNLMEEIKRLNQAFGIGVIELDSNPYQSKVLYQPLHRELDFKTIDKLCLINKNFEVFIEQVEKLLSANEKYHNAVEKELDEVCDSHLATDAEVAAYCKEKNIPSKYIESINIL